MADGKVKAVKRPTVNKTQAAPAQAGPVGAPDFQQTLSDPQSAAPGAVLALQQAAGNEAVSGLLQGDGLTPAFSEAVRQSRGAGLALPPLLRQEMETRLQNSFGSVRLHTDAQADRLSQQISAKAFTIGSDIYFRQGAFNPHTAVGRQTLRHELTHVVQQGGRLASTLRLGAENDAHEREAERISRGEGTAAISLGAQPAASAAGVVQCFRWPWQKKQKVPATPTLQDQDLLSLARPKGGTANQVYQTKHQTPGGGESPGFFKPNVGDDVFQRIEDVMQGGSEGVPLADIQGSNPQTGSTMAARAVASSRLDQWMGTGALARERFAQYTGPGNSPLVGSESEGVGGTPLFEHQFNAPHPNQDLTRAITNTKVENGVRKKLTGTTYANHDFSNPETQRGMSNLQVLDAISGQRDRHGGNVFIDAAGKTKGIDSDLSFGGGIEDFANLKLSRVKPENNGGAGSLQYKKALYKRLNDPGYIQKWNALPSHIDRQTAKTMLKKKSKDLDSVLNSEGSQQQLSPQEIAEAKLRFKVTKRYIKGGMATTPGSGASWLQRRRWKKYAFDGEAPKIVSNWNNQTFNEQVNAAPRATFPGNRYGTYLQNAHLAQAANPNPPVVAPPPPELAVVPPPEPTGAPPEPEAQPEVAPALQRRGSFMDPEIFRQRRAAWQGH